MAWAKCPGWPPFDAPDGRWMLRFIWLLVLAVLLLSRNLLDSRQGRAIRALAGGRAMAESMGVDTAQLALWVFLIAALYAGLSGWLYAHVQHLVSPNAVQPHGGDRVPVHGHHRRRWLAMGRRPRGGAW